MRIGIDASRLNISEKTGTEWYSYYLIKNILDIDRDNQYFLFSREKLDNEFLNYPNTKNIVLSWKFRYFWTILKLSYSIRKYNLDMFFSPAHYVPICSCKKVVTWHDLGYEYYREYYSKKQLTSLKYGARALKKADAIITPSFFTKNDIINKYNIDVKKIFAIHLGIDFNKYQKEYSNELRDATLKKYEINDNNYVIFIGRLETKKNISIIIDSYNYFRDNFKSDIKLLLVGKNGYEYDIINTRIKQSSYAKDIKVIGWLEEDEKICLLKNAKIYLNFSHFEGFGITIIEAMFSRVPILLSNLEVFKELGVHEYCFCQNDARIIAIKMDTMLSNNDLRNEIINKNYSIAQQYSWKQTAEKTIEVFNKLK